MRVGSGRDHAGFELKAMLVSELNAAGHEVVEFKGGRYAERLEMIRGGYKGGLGR